MQLSDLPTKMPVPWAANATAPNVAPVPINPPGPAGRASFSLGFPPETFVDPLAGGTPPFGEDMNGIEQQITQWLRWYQASAPVQYDGAFQSAIGGYPVGSRVFSATAFGLIWISTADNNTTNPDTGGSGWLQVGSYTIQQITGTGVTNVTVPTGCSSCFMQGWGGGGGSSGSDQGSNVGSGGAGGGYAAGWFMVLPGQTLVCTVPTGGAPAVNANPAGNGGTMTVVRSAVTLISATGGAGGSAGPGAGGIGTVGQILRQGQAGTDMDGSLVTSSILASIGGAAAGGGGLGGNINSAGVRFVPTQPGGGGGANFYISLGQIGAAGEIDLFFRIG